jgi:hypothetical protein
VERAQVGYPLVLPPQGTTIRQHADSLFVQCGIALPAQRLETLSLALSRRYLLGSDALWVAPRDAVLLDLRRNELAELDLGVREPGRLGGHLPQCRLAAEPPRAVGVRGAARGGGAVPGRPVPLSGSLGRAVFSHCLEGCDGDLALHGLLDWPSVVQYRNLSGFPGSYAGSHWSWPPDKLAALP